MNRFLHCNATLKKVENIPDLAVDRLHTLTHELTRHVACMCGVCVCVHMCTVHTHTHNVQNMLEGYTHAGPSFFSSIPK